MTKHLFHTLLTQNNRQIKKKHVFIIGTNFDKTKMAYAHIRDYFP